MLMDAVWLQSRKHLQAIAGSLDDDSPPSSSDSFVVEDVETGKGRRSGGGVPDNAAIARDGYGASWPQQYSILLRRALKVRRFEALSIQDMVQCVCVSVLSGLPHPKTSFQLCCAVQRHSCPLSELTNCNAMQVSSGSRLARPTQYMAPRTAMAASSSS